VVTLDEALRSARPAHLAAERERNILVRDEPNLVMRAIVHDLNIARAPGRLHGNPLTFNSTPAESSSALEG
jgi:hypothetical protein